VMLMPVMRSTLATYPTWYRTCLINPPAHHLSHVHNGGVLI
jgi:hypothetical protein